MRIELVSSENHGLLVDLLCELHHYYHPGSSLPPELMRTHLLHHLLAADSPLRLGMALKEGGRAVGFVAVSLTYSLVEAAPASRRQCQLKELYVRSAERSRGVGRQLMRWVAQYALDKGCCRLDWPVNAANRRGIAFYEGLGAQLVADRLSYRLSGGRLKACAEATNW
ncbi:GNAT family N-acetyltransferase [uncultured Hymenobacter sp.]|uniref:GNAT family N-acetyltransferase n=1 Tax=uncultured Hymenobacter sp. TaxID=170016 RepID=UPI0035CC87A2